MAVSGVVRITPITEDMKEATLHCEGGGLDRPLAECNNKQLGYYGEDLACLYLESMGLEILERNWRCMFGEVDIIAVENGMLALIEVKTRIARACDTDVLPELAVTYRKQSRYRKLALLYLSKQTKWNNVRFDVVAIRLTNEHDAQVRYHPFAYEWDE